MRTGLPLLDWQPVAPPGARTVIPFPVVQRCPRGVLPPGPLAMVAPFPQDRRLAKVADVATKLLTKTTSRAVAHYRKQVTEAMEVHLHSRRVPPA